MSHANPETDPLAPRATASAPHAGTDHAAAVAASSRTRTTEQAALGNLIDHHAQIMDMLGRDPDNAIDDAWEHAGEILALSIHAVSTVLRQRRIRQENARVVAAVPEGTDLVGLVQRVFGMPA